MLLILLSDLCHFALEDKYYYLIFEESISLGNLAQQYLVIKMEKENSPTDLYLQDISTKITSQVNKLKMACMLSDENIVYLIYNVQTIGEDLDYIEDLDLINNYIKSD